MVTRGYASVYHRKTTTQKPKQCFPCISVNPNLLPAGVSHSGNVAAKVPVTRAVQAAPARNNILSRENAKAVGVDLKEAVSALLVTR